MQTRDGIKRIKVQTSIIPTEQADLSLREKTKGIALHYKKDEFVCQSFFTPPAVGEINWIDGLTIDADVHFREIELIGTDLMLLYVVGKEEDVLKMCRSSKLYNILWKLYPAMNERGRSRRYIDISVGKPGWHVILSLDKKSFYIANNVKLINKKIRIKNVIVLGDRLFGLTDKQEVVTAQLIPDIIEKHDAILEVELVEEINKHGKIDNLELMPNVETSFLATIKNTIYQFDLDGEMLRFKLLDESIKKINSVCFNNTRTVMATTDGLYEIEVREMPNMIKATSLPRMIVAPNLKDNFSTAIYVEDPDVLGVNPAIGIFAKTEDERVVFF